MGDSKHTPPRWVKSHLPQRSGDGYSYGGENTVAIEDGPTLILGSTERDEKYARLIAAAPELLEALRELEYAIERRWAGETERRRANALSPRIEEALTVARAAIKKAEGR